MTRLQCQHCPWKTTTKPARDIPGYSKAMHEGLSNTIAEGLASFTGSARAMACHETRPGRELPCVGWLENQLGDGNNLALRMAVALGKIDGDVRTVGPQHRTLADTIPE